MAFYSGKREQNKKSGFWRRPALVVLSLAMLLLVSVGGTLAFLVDKTDSVQNTFTPSTMTTTIEEDFDEETKEDVQIKNTGEVDAWIRATVIFNWADAAGNPVKQVDMDDLNITWYDSGWFQGTDGYYYHEDVVTKNGGLTDVLITSVKLADGITPPAGADHLQVTIVSQAIQSSPEAALTATGWPVQINGGQLTAK